HDNGDVPSRAETWSALLPAAPPGPGQQYAFEVDLDRCSGCKACVTACHNLNGLDENETWRDVGLLIGGGDFAGDGNLGGELPVVQHVTAACHHCLEPGCLAACPVDAYEKHPLTGIVRHLDDQCIGCQYCTLACPYDVPKYNPARGIVRKCDLCSSRLAAGEPPACAQACPNQAISIRVVDRQRVIDDAHAGAFLPGAPDPHITLPTTTYKTRRAFPRNTLPADYHAVRRQHAHWPLVVMLVLTQLSVGAFVVELVLARSFGAAATAAIRPVHVASGLGFGVLALAASVLHLGRPQLAFRAVIGLRHSWLSREIVAFGAFAGLAVVYVGVCLAGWPAAEVILGWAVAASGLAGVLCSVMIYRFTRRELWNGPRTTVRFLLTTAVLGLAAAWLTLWLCGVLGRSVPARQLVSGFGPVLCRSLIAAVTLKLLFEAAVFVHLRDRRNTSLRRTARLMAGELSDVMLARFACGLLGGVCMPAFLLLSATREQTTRPGEVFLTVAVALLFVACLAGELLERYLFFAAVAPPRMPGGG
ncbi:MAG TPA: DmsC/YnfH family molybdoenzyme membrane anchor subunit, partial [Planctomycetaceae bacterium]|nr:DmsC/YnfH family molybdoenzyme membrane anchor subunit [Planctomycetaceae bacterium]